MILANSTRKCLGQVTWRATGFTLTEVIITVAIIGILAATSYPNYLRYVTKSRRADAVEYLLDIATKQELHFARRGTYTLQASDIIKRPNPTQSSDGFYTLELEACGADIGLDLCYSATATPVGAQAERDEECTSFTITSRGNRTATGTAEEGANPDDPLPDNSSDCW